MKANTPAPIIKKLLLIFGTPESVTPALKVASKFGVGSGTSVTGNVSSKLGLGPVKVITVQLSSSSE